MYMCVFVVIARSLRLAYAQDPMISVRILSLFLSQQLVLNAFDVFIAETMYKLSLLSYCSCSNRTRFGLKLKLRQNPH